MPASPPRLRRRRAALSLLAASALASAVLLLRRATDGGRRRGSSRGSTLRNNILEDAPGATGSQQHRRQLLNLAQFTDPKSVAHKREAPTVDADNLNGATPPVAVEVTNEHFTPVDHQSRQKCQIVYILGVEGATHHGFIPILENLARNQVDPATNLPYSVDTDPRALKAGLFGWYYRSKIERWGFKVTPEVDDPEIVRHVVRDSCPDDGTKHVLVEWASFPSGHEDDPRSYRVHRSHEWLAMTPEEVANSDEALSHPTSMNAFYQAYSPYVDIKFVVLHRPFLETIASHRDWDGGPDVHSNVIRGFMLMLRRFLDTHLFDLVTGSRLWTLVCVERIMAKNYGTEHDVRAARKRVLGSMTEFLGWPNGDCPHCFDDWHESRKDPLAVLGEVNVPMLREHMTWLEGVWPPPGEEGVAEQQCGI